MHGFQLLHVEPKVNEAENEDTALPDSTYAKTNRAICEYARTVTMAYPWAYAHYEASIPT